MKVSVEVPDGIFESDAEMAGFVERAVANAMVDAAVVPPAVPVTVYWIEQSESIMAFREGKGAWEVG